MITRCFIVFWFRSLNHICLGTCAAESKFSNKETADEILEYHLLYEWYLKYVVPGEHLCVMIQ